MKKLAGLSRVLAIFMILAVQIWIGVMPALADAGPAPAVMVTYNGNGSDGGTAVPGGTYNIGSSVSIQSCTYTKTGYSFAGWNSSPGGIGSNYSVGSSVTLTTNLNLFAQWAAASGTFAITGFTPILINAPTIGNETYLTSASVRAFLLSNHGLVSANSSGGTVSVPVISWADTDGFNPAIARSYTFTAVLGAIPAGYENRGGYAATAEVIVIGGDAPTLTITGTTGFWTSSFSKGGISYNLIRYGSPGLKTVGELESALSAGSGSIKVFDLNSAEITGSTSAIVSTGCTVRLYDAGNNLVATYGIVYKGDLNGDGQITQTDLQEIKRIFAGTAAELSVYAYSAADVNSDNHIIGTDATLLNRAISGTYTIIQANY